MNSFTIAWNTATTQQAQNATVKYSVQTETRISLRELAKLCGHEGQHIGSFKQKLRLTQLTTHEHTKDTTFSRILDQAGYDRKERSTWREFGVPMSAVASINKHIPRRAASAYGGDAVPRQKKVKISSSTQAL